MRGESTKQTQSCKNIIRTEVVGMGSSSKVTTSPILEQFERVEGVESESWV